jgi:hypothetical protein
MDMFLGKAELVRALRLGLKARAGFAENDAIDAGFLCFATAVKHRALGIKAYLHAIPVFADSLEGDRREFQAV